LANKDGSGLVYSQQIQENTKKRKEEKAIENKATPPLLENKPTQEAINQEAPTHKHKIFDKAFREANNQKSVKPMTKELGNLFEQHTKRST
ncbi:hypothetical protein ACOWMZ_07240, partial [Helicobacter pylori]